MDVKISSLEKYDYLKVIQERDSKYEMGKAMRCHFDIWVVGNGMIDIDRGRIVRG